MIISLSGRAGSGKDTVGSIIQYLTHSTVKENELTFREFSILKFSQEAFDWKIKKWADSLRKVTALLLNVDVEYTYTEEFKETTLPEEWGTIVKASYGQEYIDYMTGRDFLQKLGTDAIRNGLHPNTWVNALLSQYQKSLVSNRRFHRMELFTEEDEDLQFNEEYPKWIITDTRFPNELDAIKKLDALTIRVNRGEQANSANLHESETALDNAVFDYVIENDSSIEELVQKVKNVLVKEKIIS